MKEIGPDACKGMIPYYSFMSRETSQALVDHIEDRIGTYGEILPDEPLFISSSTNYPAELRRKTPIQKTTLGIAVKRAARKSGISDWKNVFPHCLRNAFESALRNNGIDVKDQEFLMGHILPGSQDVYYDSTKQDTLRDKYVEVDFFPKQERMNKKQRDKFLISNMRILGYSEEEIKEYAMKLEKAKTDTEAFEIYGNLPQPRIQRNTPQNLERNTEYKHKIVVGDDALKAALDEGWEFDRELNGDKVVLKRLS